MLPTVDFIRSYSTDFVNIRNEAPNTNNAMIPDALIDSHSENVNMPTTIAIVGVALVPTTHAENIPINKESTVIPIATDNISIDSVSVIVVDISHALEDVWTNMTATASFNNDSCSRTNRIGTFLTDLIWSNVPTGSVGLNMDPIQNATIHGSTPTDHSPMEIHAAVPIVPNHANTSDVPSVPFASDQSNFNPEFNTMGGSSTYMNCSGSNFNGSVLENKTLDSQHTIAPNTMP